LALANGNEKGAATIPSRLWRDWLALRGEGCRKLSVWGMFFEIAIGNWLLASCNWLQATSFWLLAKVLFRPCCCLAKRNQQENL
jgi:hypothetical protein